MANSFLLLETGDFLLKEDGDKILLELSVSVEGKGQLNVEKMVAVKSSSLGNFYAIKGENLGSFNAINSLNLDKFKVIVDG